jgi:acyl-CoA synthetase (AMP-forming)/AMP-acid ligase II
MDEHRTIARAIEDVAATADATHGFRFLPDTGVPGFPGAETSADPLTSFAQLERESARMAGALQDLGLRKGDRVALIVPGNQDFVRCFLGAIRAGIVPVPVYPPLGLGQLQTYLDNTRHIVARAGARALVTNAMIKRLLGTVQEACPALERVVTIESLAESNAPFRAETITLDDVAFLQFTSGSTSRPKGVTLTHGNLAENIRCIMDLGLKVRRGDSVVSWLPLYHDMGLIGFVLAPIFRGTCVTFMSAMTFLKRPVTWFEAMTRYRGEATFAPNFAYALAVKRIREPDLAGIDLSAWRVAGCGAEPVRAETLEAFSDRFARVGFRRAALTPSYGMAESSLAIAFTELGEGLKTVAVHGPTLWEKGEVVRTGEDDEDVVRLVSCGHWFPEHKLAIYDPQDAQSAAALPEGRVGEIRIAGPSVMKGYWQDEETTRAAFAGEMLKTGDLGFVLDGKVFICGRSKEIVIVHGRNYYPQDIEWEASKVPGVRKGNVIAFGARDPAGKEADRERVVVAFEIAEGTSAAASDALVVAVRRAVQEGLGLTIDEAVPLAAGALPKTSSGKLQRARTRALYEGDELSERKSARDVSRLEVAKHAAMSQLSYLKLAVLGGRKRTEKP